MALRNADPLASWRWLFWPLWRTQPGSKASWILSGWRCYLLPTRLGVGLGLCALIIWLFAAQYQITLGFALSYFLFSLWLLSFWATARQMHGLRATLIVPEPVTLSNDLSWELHLAVEEGEPERAFGVVLYDPQSGWGASAEMVVFAQARCIFRQPTTRRGVYAAPLVAVSTVLPFGLVRAFAVLASSSSGFVAPKPQRCALLQLAITDSKRGDFPDRSSEGIEWQGWRVASEHEPLRRLHLRRFVRSNELLVAELGGEELLKERALMLSWRSCPKGGEACLACLTWWVLWAEQRGIPYGLQLPGATLSPGVGRMQRAAALRLLALAAGEGGSGVF